jgi:hypothetical protein
MLRLTHSTSPLTGTAGPALSVVHRAELPDITSVTLRGHLRKPGMSIKADHPVRLSRNRYETPECQSVPVLSRQKLSHPL